MSKNKIVDYYKPNDERLGEYYFGHIKMLGLDKQPYGLDEQGTLRFQRNETDSRVWKKYRELDDSLEIDEHSLKFIVASKTIHGEFQNGKFTMEEMMQFYREIGYSLCGYLDVWTERFYEVEDAKEFQKALDRLKTITELEKATQDVMSTLLLAHLDSVNDELTINYRKEVKRIIDENFGEGTWKNFIESVKNKKNEN